MKPQSGTSFGRGSSGGRIEDTKTLLDSPISPKSLWQSLRSQPAGFQFACLYIFFEYVRPQSRFPALDVLPWTMLVILIGLLFCLRDLALSGRTKSAANWLLLLYFIVVLISLYFSEFPKYGMQRWDYLLPWLFIFFFLTNSVTSRDKFFLIILIYILCNFRLSQFGLRYFLTSSFTLPGYGFRGPVGWFANQGELGIQMAMFTPIALLFAYSLWGKVGRIGRLVLSLLPASALITTIGTNSRGSILAVAIAIVWVLLAIGIRLRNILIVTAFLGGGFLLLGDNIMSRFETMGQDDTSSRRLIFWNDGLQMIQDHPVIGIGYFNWMPYYEQYFPAVDNIRYLGTHQLPHNILIQVTAELGFVGLFVFLLLVTYTFYLNSRTRKLINNRSDFFSLMSSGLDAAMVAYLVAGQFVTVLYYPYFWVHLTLTVALYESCRRDLLPVSRHLTSGRDRSNKRRAIRCDRTEQLQDGRHI